jgi:hypothetical protein
MASILQVEELRGPTSGANVNKVIIPSGQTLDINDWSPPAGTVLQAVTAQSGAEQTFSSASWTASNCSATITPSSTSSKIIVIASIPVYAASSYIAGTVFRGPNLGTQLFGASFGFGYATTGTDVGCLSGSTIDSPNTTSAVTYTIAARSNGSGNIGPGSSTPSDTTKATLTLMEIAG